MALELPKENATQEEINAWIIDTQEKYNNMETELEQKKQREQELLEHNQKLFLKVTSKKEEEDNSDTEEEIPLCIDKDTYDKLSEKELKELNDLIEEE